LLVPGRVVLSLWKLSSGKIKWKVKARINIKIWKNSKGFPPKKRKISKGK